MSFSEATAVERRPGTGSYDTHIAEGWDIAGRANGGYLLSLAARAMADLAGRPDPVTVTAHYLSPGEPGPAVVEAEVVKAGKRFATVRATLANGDGRPLLAVIGSFSDLAPAHPPPPERVDAEPPDLPPPDGCVHLAGGPGGFPPSFATKVELRLHPDDAGFARGEPSGHPRVRGWFRLPGDEPVGSLGLLTAVDAFPPTIFNVRLDLPVAWTPTLELTAHVRARPAGGWLRCSFGTRFVTGGFLEADGEVWDDTGALVAQSRQLALLPRPT